MTHDDVKIRILFIYLKKFVQYIELALIDILL